MKSLSLEKGEMAGNRLKTRAQRERKGKKGWGGGVVYKGMMSFFIFTAFMPRNKGHIPLTPAFALGRVHVPNARK